METSKTSFIGAEHAGWISLFLCLDLVKERVNYDKKRNECTCGGGCQGIYIIAIVFVGEIGMLSGTIYL